MNFPAQIVFTEVEQVLGPRRWRGRLLNPLACVDTESGKPVTWTPIFDIVEDAKTGKCVVTMQGGPDRGGRRYANHLSVSEAQRAGIRWASRRFRIEA